MHIFKKIKDKESIIITLVSEDVLSKDWDNDKDKMWDYIDSNNYKTQ